MMPLIDDHIPISAMCPAEGYALGDQLRSFQLDNVDLFRNLFWLGHSIRYQKKLELFIECGLIVHLNGLMNSAYQIWCQDGTVIITDRPDYPSANRVFPLFPDENIALARMGLWANRRSVADVGTGSGFLAINAAREGCRVFATDINPRALHFARLNAAMNGLAGLIKFSEQDALSKSHSRLFDLIVSNPPFAPAPTDDSFHLAGNGGRLGNSVIQKILESRSQLTPDGVIAFTALNLRGPRRSLLNDMLKPLADEGFASRQLRVYPDTVSFKLYSRCYDDTAARRRWAEAVLAMGYDRVEYVFTVIGKGPLPHVVFPQIHQSKYSGNWQRRFARYNLWSRIRGTNVQEQNSIFRSH